MLQQKNVAAQEISSYMFLQHLICYKDKGYRGRIKGLKDLGDLKNFRDFRGFRNFDGFKEILRNLKGFEWK